MMLETKFELGQKVWCVMTHQMEKAIACDLCKDTKKVIIDKVEYKCPKCSDRGLIKWFTRMIVYGSGFIGKVNIESYADKAFCKDYRGEHKETYMLDCTGIGSGSVWNVNDLFPSEELAQQFCDEKNAEREKIEKETL